MEGLAFSLKVTSSQEGGGGHGPLGNRPEQRRIIEAAASSHFQPRMIKCPDATLTRSEPRDSGTRPRSRSEPEQA